MYIDLIKLKNKLLDSLGIVIMITIIILVLIFGIILNSEDSKPKKYTPPTKVEKPKPSMIIHNLICRGNGKLVVEFNDDETTYDIEGILDFELSVEENTNIEINWKSMDKYGKLSDDEMEISLTGQNVEKDIKCKSGDLVVNVGHKTDCFINSIR